MRVTFNIRQDLKSKKTAKVPVSMTITHDGFKIRKLISGISVYEKDWSSTNQRIKPSKKDEAYNNYAEFNAKLDGLSNRLNKMWSHHLIEDKGQLTKQMIIDHLDGKKELDSEATEIYFIDCFEEFINQSKSHRAVRTITGYYTVKNIISNFQTKTGSSYTLDEINLNFFDRIRNYCFEDKAYRNNMFARIITNIKTVMSWAEDRNYHSNNAYTKFKASEEQIEVIYLTYNELMTLYEYEFSPDLKFLDKVRNIYCFAAFTGLRYSDLANLKHSNIFGDELHLTVTKTREQNHIIPLNNYAIAILDKYKSDFGGPLPMISSQKLNEYIKLACKQVGIDSDIRITRYSGSKRIEKIIPKYQAISIHSARKSFVTNSLILGMNQAVVKAVSGHKSDSAFRKYVNISSSVSKDEMSKAWNK